MAVLHRVKVLALLLVITRNPDSSVTGVCWGWWACSVQC